MFQLAKGEFKNLIFHFGTSSWGGTRKLPRAFTDKWTRGVRTLQEKKYVRPAAMGFRYRYEL